LMRAAALMPQIIKLNEVEPCPPPATTRVDVHAAGAWKSLHFCF
jgi:hypothetical protein